MMPGMMPAASTRATDSPVMMAYSTRITLGGMSTPSVPATATVAVAIDVG